MFYRENGQFKTTYASDQQIFGVAQDRWAIVALLARPEVPLTPACAYFAHCLTDSIRQPAG